MKKKIIINNIIYTFTYVEDLNRWIIYENEDLFFGYNIEILLGLNYSRNNINWEEISSFFFFTKRK